MTDRLTLQCWNPQQAHQAMTAQAWPLLKAMLAAGHRMVLEIRPISKTREQENKYHAIIEEIAEQAQHLGAKWEADDWKRLLIDKFARDTGRTHGKVILNLDKSGVVEVGVQSRKFSIADGSEFITWLHHWSDENGLDVDRIDQMTGEIRQ